MHENLSLATPVRSVELAGSLSILVEGLNERSCNLTLRLKIKHGEVNEFENKSRIYQAKLEEIILIQRDKPISRFRVVLLDADLKPLNGHKLENVQKISDAEGNVVKVWQGATRLLWESSRRNWSCRVSWCWVDRRSKLKPRLRRKNLCYALICADGVTLHSKLDKRPYHIA